jgi:hypothetical protein
MADKLKKIIDVEVQDNASAKLQTIDDNITKVTQSTDTLTKKTENNSKSLRDNGGAMGFLGAATRGASNDIKDAIEAVEGLGISFKGLRGALAATLVGFAALAILELITNWEKWSKVIDGTADAMERLNAAVITLQDTREKESRLFDVLIAQKQDELRLEIAKNGQSERAKQLTKEINEESVKYFKAKLTSLEEETKLLENAWQWDEKRLQLSRDQAIAAASGNKEKIAQADAALTIYQRESSIFKDLTKLNKDIVDVKVKINNLETDPKVIQAQKEREEGLKRFNDLLEKEKKHYDEIAQKLRKNLDTIKSIYAETYQFQFDENGELFRKLMGLSDLFYKNQKALYDANKGLYELEASYKKITDTIINDPTLNEDEKKKALEDAKKIKEDKEKSLNLTQKEINLRNRAVDSEKALKAQVDKTLKAVNEKEESVGKSIDKQLDYNDLQLELFNLQNGLLEFEKGFQKNGKWLDDRTNNSRKYAEIEKRINDIYDLRLKLQAALEQQQIGDLDVKARELDTKIGEAEQRKNKYDTELADMRKRGISVNSDEYLAVAKLQNEADAQLQDFRDQAADVALKRQSVYLDGVYTVEELAAARSIELENNTLNKKQALRDEEFERQKMYAEKTIGVAEETATFLDSIAAISGKKGQDLAKAALALRKGAGVASVVISTQEEIRGIWANPALTALPDTGITKKILLTAAAAARSAVSIATILSQKISSSGSGSATGANGGPQAQFNIVESSGTNQLASTIAAQQNRPVNAYVVGTDVSTQQALDRNRVQTATFL